MEEEEGGEKRGEARSFTEEEGGGVAESSRRRQEKVFTETVELGVLVPYPEEGREARDQRLPSVLRRQTSKSRLSV